MELVKKLRVKYYATCPKTKMGLFKEPHVCFNDLNSCLSKLETQAKTIERLEAENRLLEECRAFYADPENWTRRETIFWESIDRADCKDYPHIARNVRLTGGHMARETAKKIEALRKKE